ncbi:Hint domain-containing protein [Rhodovulum sp. DZ06]|uniref:Hint domain-containing protein n=1 Tax=Rhodovulum sp. DZ06 TaxID=3425126 RepID=UPI003D34AEB5
MATFYIFEPGSFSDPHLMLDPNDTSAGQAAAGDGFRFTDLSQVAAVEVAGTSVPDAGVDLAADFTDYAGGLHSPPEELEANYEFILRDPVTGYYFRVTQLTVGNTYVGAAVSSAWDAGTGSYLTGPDSVPPTTRDLVLIAGDTLNGTPNIADFKTDSNYTSGDLYGNDAYITPTNAPLICFDADTRIETPGGPVPVGALGPGDVVETLDRGPQPLLWVERRRVCALSAAADPRLRWVEIAPGALGGLGGTGPAAALRITRQHRVLLGGLLVPARMLIGRPGVSGAPAQAMDCVHLLTRDHALIRAEGAWAETLLPGPRALAGLSPAGRAAAAGAGEAPARPLADGRAFRAMLARLPQAMAPQAKPAPSAPVSAKPR